LNYLDISKNTNIKFHPFSTSEADRRTDSGRTGGQMDIAKLIVDFANL